MISAPVERDDLRPLGWDATLAAALAALAGPALIPARVFGDRRGVFSLFDGARPHQARLAGRLRHNAPTAADLPVVGDWVAFRPLADNAAADAGELATIHAVLPRRTRIARKVAGDRPDEQVLAANVDIVLILMGLDGDLNARRLDRYLTLARAGGARPFVLLTKADLAADAERGVAELRALFAGVPMAAARLLDGDLPTALAAELAPGRTLVLVGSSGVGKSTLINRLVGKDVQRTAAVRGSDSRGRHTTTYRQMFAVAGGALVIDTPGLREIQLSDADAGSADAFPDIAALAPGCRFRDCHHNQQPGCAVAAAVADGTLPAGRLASYQLLAAGAAGHLGAPPPARRRRRGSRG